MWILIGPRSEIVATINAPAPDASAATAMRFAVPLGKVARRAVIKVLNRICKRAQGGGPDTFQHWHFPEIYPSCHDPIAPLA
jgi:hypothetical protein